MKFKNLIPLSLLFLGTLVQPQLSIAEEKIEVMKSAGITISKSPADIGKTLFDKLNS